MTITVRLRKDRINSRGESPLELLIFNRGRNRQISLKRSVRPEFWNDKKKMVKTTDGSSQLTNSIIRREVAKVQGIIDKMILAEEDLDLDLIVDTYRGKKVDKRNLVNFVDYYIELNPERIKYGTVKYYRTCRERLFEYRPDASLQDVDQEFLTGFEKYLVSQGNSTNTIYNRFKVLRRIIRFAKKEKFTDKYPFEDFRLKTEESQRDFLSMTELNTLISLENLASTHELIRDVYVFSATTGGIRFGDLCTITQDNIITQNGNARIRFRNAKTKEIIEFPLTKFSLSIITKYRDDNRITLFPLLKEIPEDYPELLNRISSANAYANKVLKILAEKAKIGKRLTMHTARHSFATISLENEIPTEVIGKILGHKDLETTQIYTKILDKAKNKAINVWDKLLPV